jgi:hypothetical protein
MPSKSKKQANFMRAVANNPKFAKEAGVPQSVGEEFVKADKKMAYGGKSKKMMKGGKTGYRSSCDGMAKKGRTRAK